jgi:hypothetical protein
MNTSTRRAAALCALLAATALSAADPAHAETKLVSTPADRFMIAPGGVDMRTGRYVYSQTDLSVGQGESLFELKRIMKALVRGHIDPFGNFSHNWDISLSEKRVNIDQHSFDHGSGTDFRINVNYGGLTETFQSRSIHTGFTPLSTGPRPSLTYTGDRASATALYTFTAADGTIVNFRRSERGLLIVGSDAPMSRPSLGRCTTLSFDYHYDAALPNNRARLRASRAHAAMS